MYHNHTTIAMVTHTFSRVLLSFVKACATQWRSVEILQKFTFLFSNNFCFIIHQLYNLLNSESQFTLLKSYVFFIDLR